MHIESMSSRNCRSKPTWTCRIQPGLRKDHQPDRAAPSESRLMFAFVLISFLVPFCVSVVAAPVVRHLAPSLGLVDLPGHRKVHVQPTPMGGGIAIMIGLGIAAALPIILSSIDWDQLNQFRTLASQLSESSLLQRQIIAIVVGAAILFGVGLADDRWNLTWKLRLGTQLAVATAVALAGVRATLFVSQPWIGLIATILWIVVLTNALNFLDNMDGLSAGIGFISSVLAAVILLGLVKEPRFVVAFGLLILSGALSGFLCWNRPPASIFMGDCGSNLVGFLLATLTVTGTFYEHSGSRHVILAPVCVLAIPLYDFLTVILIRIKQGRSPFHGDKSHFSHRLVELGLRPAHAVLTIHLTTLMTGLGGLLLYKISDWTGAWLVISLICCVLSVVAILETVGRRDNESAEQQSSDVTESDSRHS